jgi:hypothetical protein
VERTLVEERRGWLVAMNGGEFSGGLFWVPRGTAQPVPLDRVLVEPVRWITRTSFGIVGVAGLCHGYGPELKTVVYELHDVLGDDHWRLRLLSVFPGCPTALALAPGGDAVLVLADFGGLKRVDRAGTQTVAMWSQLLSPMELVATGGPDSPRRAPSGSRARTARSFATTAMRAAAARRTARCRLSKRAEGARATCRGPLTSGSKSARRSSARCVTSLVRVAMDSKGRFRSNIDQILRAER